MNLVIVYWLSINDNYTYRIYYKVYKGLFLEKVGYTNSFGHVVIAIQRYSYVDCKFKTIDSWLEPEDKFSNETLKTKLINKIIDKLERIKGKNY